MDSSLTQFACYPIFIDWKKLDYEVDNEQVHYSRASLIVDCLKPIVYILMIAHELLVAQCGSIDDPFMDNFGLLCIIGFQSFVKGVI